MNSNHSCRGCRQLSVHSHHRKCYQILWLVLLKLGSTMTFSTLPCSGKRVLLVPDPNPHEKAFIPLEKKMQLILTWSLTTRVNQTATVVVHIRPRFLHYTRSDWIDIRGLQGGQLAIYHIKISIIWYCVRQFCFDSREKKGVKREHFKIWRDNCPPWGINGVYNSWW